MNFLWYSEIQYMFGIQQFLSLIKEISSYIHIFILKYSLKPRKVCFPNYKSNYIWKRQQVKWFVTFKDFTIQIPTFIPVYLRLTLTLVTSSEMKSELSIKQATYIFINPKGTLVARTMSQYAY